MTKLKTAAVAILSAVGGLVLGIGGASWFWGKFSTEGVFAAGQAGIVSKFTVLDQLRRGNVGAAVGFLELQMDGDLIGTASFVRDGHQLSESVRQIVQKERAARGTSGYEPIDAALKAPVQESIDLLAGGLPSPGPR